MKLKASKKPFSVYAGETWRAFRPGEDETFPDAWTSYRGALGNQLCTVVGSKEELLQNAKLCQVKLKFKAIRAWNRRVKGKRK